MSRKKYSLVGEICDIEYHGAWGDYCAPGPLKAFLKTLGKDDVAEIEINSPGGYVLQGIEMANAIKNCPAKIVAHVTGIAASMASVVMCACDEIEMEEASFAMFHDPWSFAMGNAKEMRKEADLLDQMKSVIISFYRGKFAKKSNEEISAMLSDETWYTGNECAENGMACTVIPATVRAAAMVNHNFANIPEGAKKFMSAFTLSDAAKAELEKLRAKAAATEEEETPDEEEETPAEEEETPAEEEETPTEEETPAEEEETPDEEEEEEETPPPSPSGAVDWQARYKGASKKINELNATLAATSAAGAALEDFNSQIKAAGFKDLAALIASASSLKADLEKRDQALADAREQLEHMKKTRSLLTGGVLTPALGKSYKEQLEAARTPEERERLRALKKAGKLN